MMTVLPRSIYLALGLLLPLSLGAQPLATVIDSPQVPIEANAPAAEPVGETPAPAIAPVPVLEGCRPLTDKAMAADMKAMTAQSQKFELAVQAQLVDESQTLWTQAVAQCEGRAKDRAQRNLTDTQKMRASLSEQLDSGPQCASAHKDAGALQDMANQAMKERRWNDGAMLYRKAENMWDIASERCTGSQQETANKRREQSEIDGLNAEFCAPLFDKALDQTKKFRAAAGGLSREEKQDASMVAETLWRDALGQCKGAAVQDSARNNAQALARDRGTPWVARVAPAIQPTIKPLTPPVLAAKPAPSSQLLSVVAAVAPSTSAVPKMIASVATPTPTPALVAKVDPSPQVLAVVPVAKAAEFVADTTRYSGQFVRDLDGTSYSGTGKVAWASGDVYEGTLVKGQRHGKGLIVWASGQSYNGDWVNDKPVGQASIQFANGNQYEGGVIDGVPQGQGRMRYASGDTYTGQFTAGGPDGRGLYIWKNGQQFEGEWKNERPNGQGKLKFSTGNQYEGSVKDGLPHGKGRMVFASGDTYVGNSVNGQPDGEGTFSWTNGSQYSGQWKAGKKHGQGAFSWKNGDRWEGLFENDMQTPQEDLAAKK